MRDGRRVDLLTLRCALWCCRLLRSMSDIAALGDDIDFDGKGVEEDDDDVGDEGALEDPLHDDDEEDEGEESGAAAASSAPAAKRLKTEGKAASAPSSAAASSSSSSSDAKGKKLDYSVPSSDELLDLQQTQQLFKSNLFKLQIKELLSNVQYRPEQLSRVDDLLHLIKTTLDTLPASTEHAANGESVLGVPVRLLKESGADASDSKTAQPNSKAKGKAAKAEAAGGFDAERISCPISAPARVDVVGSYLLRTVTKPILNVDVAITIPKVPSECCSPHSRCMGYADCDHLLLCAECAVGSRLFEQPLLLQTRAVSARRQRASEPRATGRVCGGAHLA
jgi:hypothetical protein